jgi:hypothetical protein
MNSNSGSSKASRIHWTMNQEFYIQKINLPMYLMLTLFGTPSPSSFSLLIIICNGNKKRYLMNIKTFQIEKIGKHGFSTFSLNLLKHCDK